MTRLHTVVTYVFVHSTHWSLSENIEHGNPTPIVCFLPLAWTPLPVSGALCCWIFILNRAHQLVGARVSKFLTLQGIPHRYCFYKPHCTALSCRNTALAHVMLIAHLKVGLVVKPKPLFSLTWTSLDSSGH